MKWTKAAVEFLENNCFHQNGKVLVRDSDIAYQELINDRLAEIRDNNTKVLTNILDFACGTARQLEINDFNDWANTGVVYYGYDKSEEMLKKAKEKFSNYFTSDLKEIDDDIDLLISNDVLQHTKNFDEFTNMITEMLLISNNVICHCWYEDQEKYQKISLVGESFDEFFVDPIKLENYFTENLKEYDFDIIRFPNERPYKCLVFTLSLKDKVADQSPTEVKEIESSMGQI